MPMTKIYMRKGSTAEHKLAISDAIHRALVDEIGIPDDDKYHVFHELDPENLVSASVAFGLERRDEAIFIQCYFGKRPEDQLRALYRALVDNLIEGAGLESRDVYINIVESPSANWWADGRALDPNTGFDERIAADKLPKSD